MSLQVVEGGKLLSPATVEAEAGIASFLVQTEQESELTLEAESQELSEQTTWTLE